MLFVARINDLWPPKVTNTLQIIFLIIISKCSKSLHSQWSSLSVWATQSWPIVRGKLKILTPSVSYFNPTTNIVPLRWGINKVWNSKLNTPSDAIVMKKMINAIHLILIISILEQKIFSFVNEKDFNVEDYWKWGCKFFFCVTIYWLDLFSALTLTHGYKVYPFYPLIWFPFYLFKQ